MTPDEYKAHLAEIGNLMAQGHAYILVVDGGEGQIAIKFHLNGGSPSVPLAVGLLEMAKAMILTARTDTLPPPSDDTRPN